MDFIYAPFLEIKVAGGNDRTFVGHGSTFNNVDTHGDTVAKGAFAKTIADCKSGASPWPAMMLNHSGQPIGAWLDMSEDTKGLRMKGQLADTEQGNTVLALLKMKPRPALNGLSIGYRAKDFDLHRKGAGSNGASRTLKAVDLVECSICTFPSDKFAVVSRIKSFDIDEPVDEAVLAKAWALSEFEAMRRLMNHVPR